MKSVKSTSDKPTPHHSIAIEASDSVYPIFTKDLSFFCSSYVGLMISSSLELLRYENHPESSLYNLKKGSEPICCCSGREHCYGGEHCSRGECYSGELSRPLQKLNLHRLLLNNFCNHFLRNPILTMIKNFGIGKSRDELASPEPSLDEEDKVKFLYIYLYIIIIPHKGAQARLICCQKQYQPSYRAALVGVAPQEKTEEGHSDPEVVFVNIGNALHRRTNFSYMAKMSITRRKESSVEREHFSGLDKFSGVAVKTRPVDLFGMEN